MADKSQRPLDRTDLRILSILEANGRISMSELAEKVSLSQSPCWRRVQLLEQAGYITVSAPSPPSLFADHQSGIVSVLHS